MKQDDKQTGRKTLKVSSPAFSQNEFIPVQYTCDGINVNPPLEIDDIPEETKSMAIIVDDPDAPSKIWIHWVMWNMPVKQEILENQAPGVQGLNDFNLHQYGGPCPPSGTHRYYFKVYALDALLELPAHTDAKQLEKIMSKHIIASGELVGLYKRAGS